MRRFAHYDYWADTVMPSIVGVERCGYCLFRHGGASDSQSLPAAWPQGNGRRILLDVAGTCYLTDFARLPPKYAECASYKKVASDKVSLCEGMPYPDGPAGPRHRPACGAEAERKISGAEPARKAADHGASWTRCTPCPSRDGIIPSMRRRAACPPLKRWSFPLSRTGAASAGAISALSPCIRAAASPRAAPTASWQRPRP